MRDEFGRSRAGRRGSWVRVARRRARVDVARVRLGAGVAARVSTDPGRTGQRCCRRRALNRGREEFVARSDPRVIATEAGEGFGDRARKTRSFVALFKADVAVSPTVKRSTAHLSAARGGLAVRLAPDEHLLAVGPAGDDHFDLAGRTRTGVTVERAGVGAVVARSRARRGTRVGGRQSRRGGRDGRLAVAEVLLGRVDPLGLSALSEERTGELRAGFDAVNERKRTWQPGHLQPPSSPPRMLPSAHSLMHFRWKTPQHAVPALSSPSLTPTSPVLGAGVQDQVGWAG